jgi:diaminopimelate decarboxylase
LQDEFGRTAAGHLEIGGCDAVGLAREFGTPLHVLDGERLRANLKAYREAFARYAPEGRPLFASKALCVVATCQLAHDAGFGLDVASGGEIHTALVAGVPGGDLVFHGNNKTPDELRYALEVDVGRIVVDNFDELDLLEELTAERDRPVDVWLRLTPGIEPHTHRAIVTGGVDTKFGFGIPDGTADRATRRALEVRGLRLRGFHSHIGSQILEMEPFVLNARTMVEYAARARAQFAYTAEELNLGGGLGIRYRPEDRPPAIDAFVRSVAQTVLETCGQTELPPPRLFLEPGRSVVGPAGVTLYTAGAVKEITGVRTYVSVDGGMYENPRPALYGARYEAVLAAHPDEAPAQAVALAGRCCESGDVLIWDARLPGVRRGDLIAVFATAAYTYSMASNYNRFPRPAVVLAEAGQARVIVQAETYADLVRLDVPLKLAAPAGS